LFVPFLKKPKKPASQKKPRPAAAPATESDTLRARQKAFLEANAICGNVSRAAEAAGIHRATHYKWMDEDSEYKRAFEDSESQFCDRVRDMVRRRAIDGVPEPIIWQGTIIRDRDTNEVITVLKRSDRILELLAKGKCPEFRDKQEITGPGGGALKIEVVTGVPQAE